MKQYTEQEIFILAKKQFEADKQINWYNYYAGFEKGFKAALSLIEKDEQQSLGCGDGWIDKAVEWCDQKYKSTNSLSSCGTADQNVYNGVKQFLLQLKQTLL